MVMQEYDNIEPGKDSVVPKVVICFTFVSVLEQLRNYALTATHKKKRNGLREIFRLLTEISGPKAWEQSFFLQNNLCISADIKTICNAIAKIQKVWDTIDVTVIFFFFKALISLKLPFKYLNHGFTDFCPIRNWLFSSSLLSGKDENFQITIKKIGPKWWFSG